MDDDGYESNSHTPIEEFEEGYGDEVSQESKDEDTENISRNRIRNNQ